MRPVIFDPNQLTDPVQQQWWDTWSSRAETATNAAISAWETWLSGNRASPFSHNFNQKIWSDLKGWLLENVFQYQCAYCETPLSLDRYHGDAEHFRPKGNVVFRNQQGQEVSPDCILPDGAVIKHPGYFWLAYHWRNLVPACSFCNSGKGKNDQFPVEGVHFLPIPLTEAEADALVHEEREELLESPKGSKKYYAGRRTLDTHEKPLLLNPLNPTSDPRQHIRFGLGGTVVPVNNSLLGVNSIEVYQLKRGTLRKERQKAQETAHRIYYSALLNPRNDLSATLKTDLADYLTYAEAYSSAVLDYIHQLQQIQALATAAALGDK